MLPGSAPWVGRAVAALAFLSLALVLTLLLDRSFPIDSDEGYTLGAAWQLWNGHRMYDDFRLFVGPGSGYCVLWLWKVLGQTSHAGARLLAVAFSFSSTIALFVLLRRLGLRALGLGLTVVGWLFVSAFYLPLNHNSISTYAAIWFLLPFLRFVDPEAKGGRRSSPVDAALAGGAAGVAFLFLPPKGALLLGAAVPFVLRGVARKRDVDPRAARPLARLLSLLAGFAVATGPLLLRWKPSTLVEQWLVIPVAGNYLGHTSASAGWLLAVLLLLALLAVVAHRAGDPRLWALLAVQAALFASVGHNLEFHHLAINLFPSVIFAGLAAARRPASASVLSRFPATLVLATVTTTLAGTGALTSAGAAYLSGSVWSVDVLGRGPKMFGGPRIAAARAIYAGPFLPGLYYLLGKENPFFVSETVVCDDACQRRLLGEIASVRPEIAFLNYAMIDPLGYDRDAPVDRYLRERYVPCAPRGFFIIRALEPRFCP